MTVQHQSTESHGHVITHSRCNLLACAMSGQQNSDSLYCY